MGEELASRITTSALAIRSIATSVVVGILIL